MFCFRGACVLPWTLNSLTGRSVHWKSSEIKRCLSCKKRCHYTEVLLLLFLWGLSITVSGQSKIIRLQCILAIQPAQQSSEHPPSRVIKYVFFHHTVWAKQSCSNNQPPADLFSCQVPHITLLIMKAHVSVSTLTLLSEVTDDEVDFNILHIVSNSLISTVLI